MEEEDGEEDTGHEDRERGQVGSTRPEHPGHITDCGEDYVDVREFLAEADTRVITTTAEVEFGESKEGNRWEDNEGGMSVEDLQRRFIKEVQSGGEREEELREKYQDDGDSEA